MEQGLQKVNHQSRLMEWGQRVEACRNSGQRVSEWCEEHGIPVSTYYSWQREVFQAVSSENTVCFAEIAVRACLKSFDKNGGVGDNRKKQAGAGENASIPKRYQPGRI